MIKKIIEYLTLIIDKISSDKSTETPNKKMRHAILKNDLTAKLNDNEQEILLSLIHI